MILLIVAAILGGLVYMKWRNGQSAPNPPPVAPVHPPTQPTFVPSPHPAPAPTPTQPAPVSAPSNPVNLLDIGAAYQAQREAEEKEAALKGFLDAVVGFAKGPTGPKA